MFLHLEDAVREGHTTVFVRMVDSDVLVLALTSLQNLNNAPLWIAFGVGQTLDFLLLMKKPMHLVPIGQ